jgi:hypothetical protein
MKVIRGKVLGPKAEIMKGRRKEGGKKEQRKLTDKGKWAKVAQEYIMGNKRR